MTIKVLVADDHAVVRRGVLQILAEVPEIIVADEATNGSEVLHAVRAEGYDVILLDMAMPDMSGLDVLRQIRSLDPDIRVLILSMYPEDQYAVRALKAGASGYLTKESAPEELVAAIRKVCHGGIYVTESLAERLATALGPEDKRLPHETLSDRELQVMRLLADGCSAKDIATKLSLSPKTISTYRSRILVKLGIKTTAEIIRYALQHDLVE
jgi:DNA-binding NarL/FixJ family response regulator